MSIVTLKKVTIAGSSDEKDKIIASLQDFGLLHVVPMSGSGKKPHLTCDEINDVITSYSIHYTKLYEVHI